MSKNKLQSILESKQKRCKSKFNQREFEEFRFHLNNMFQGIDKNKYISFGYVHGYRANGTADFHFWSFKIGEISDNILKRIFTLSRSSVVYISQNSFKRARRLSENAYASKSFILDLDYYNTKYKDLTPEQLYAVMEMDGMFDTIRPSYAFASGRGMSLVYIFKDSLPLWLNSRVKSLRKYLAEYIIEAFSNYGADPSGSDLSRINKIPGSTTLNSSKKKNTIELTRMVSNISANGYSTSREFLAAINQNLDEWETFNEEVAFWNPGDPLPEGTTLPSSPACNWVGKYIADQVYILNFNEIRNRQTHMHTVDELVAFYLPEAKDAYLARHKAEYDRRGEKWKAENEARKNKKKRSGGKKSLQTLCSSRVNDMLVLSMARAKTKTKQCRKAALLVTAHMLIGQYDYHLDRTLIGPLDIEAMKVVLLRLNDTFIKRYDEKFIDLIIRDAANKFYRAIKDGDISNDTVHKDLRFYHFRTKKIIEMLNIQPEEEKLLSVTISTKEKQRRRSMKQLTIRKEKDAIKEVRLMDQLYELINYIQRSKTGKQIAELMKISLRTVNRLKAKVKSLGESKILDFINRRNKKKKEITTKDTQSYNYNYPLKSEKVAHDPKQLSIFDIDSDMKCDINGIPKNFKAGLKEYVWKI